MKCPKCGAENTEYNNYCQGCGFGLTTAEAGAVAAPVPVKTCGLAIAALVLGILSFFSCGLAIIPALICGIIALVKISSSQGCLKGKGMAITGIVLPVVVVPLLMAILMPALFQVRLLAQRMLCFENLSMIGKATEVYADNNNGKFPASQKWCNLLIEYADASEKMFICKGACEGSCHYAMNSEIETLGIQCPG